MGKRVVHETSRNFSAAEQGGKRKRGGVEKEERVKRGEGGEEEKEGRIAFSFQN